MCTASYQCVKACFNICHKIKSKLKSKIKNCIDHVFFCLSKYQAGISQPNEASLNSRAQLICLKLISVHFHWCHHYFQTRGPRDMGRSPEWHSHCRYADVMQHLSSPVIAANEKINLQAVLNFEEEYYIWHDSQWSMIIWTNSQSHFNSRINVKFGGNRLIGFWRIMILYM